MYVVSEAPTGVPQISPRDTQTAGVVGFRVWDLGLRAGRAARACGIHLCNLACSSWGTCVRLQADLSTSTRLEAAQFTSLSGDPLPEDEFVQRVLALEVLRECPRLTSVKGFCSDRGQRWVAYEHLTRATLSDHLHGEPRCSHSFWYKPYALNAEPSCVQPIILARGTPAQVILSTGIRAQVSGHRHGSSGILV